VSIPEAAAIEVDARGLRCPLPVLRLAEELGRHPHGTPVLLLATDPAARTDVAAFCRMRRAELLTVDERPDGDDGPGHAAYLVRLSPSPPAPAASAPR